MTEFQEKLRSLSFGVTRAKPVFSKETGAQVGEQVYHKDGSVSAIVTPTIQLVNTINRSGETDGVV
jgi:hypothetical protein